jgi:hypothetical protein
MVSVLMVVAPSLTPDSYTLTPPKPAPGLAWSGISLLKTPSKQDDLIGIDLLFLKKRHTYKQFHARILLFSDRQYAY